MSFQRFIALVLLPALLLEPLSGSAASPTLRTRSAPRLAACVFSTKALISPLIGGQFLRLLFSPRVRSRVISAAEEAPRYEARATQRARVRAWVIPLLLLSATLASPQYLFQPPAPPNQGLSRTLVRDILASDLESTFGLFESSPWKSILRLERGAIRPLTMILQDAQESRRVRIAAGIALQDLDLPAAYQALIAALPSTDPQVRASLIVILQERQAVHLFDMKDQALQTRIRLVIRHYQPEVQALLAKRNHSYLHPEDARLDARSYVDILLAPPAPSRGQRVLNFIDGGLRSYGFFGVFSLLMVPAIFFAAVSGLFGYYRKYGNFGFNGFPRRTIAALIIGAGIVGILSLQKNLPVQTPGKSAYVNDLMTFLFEGGIMLSLTGLIYTLYTSVRDPWRDALWYQDTDDYIPSENKRLHYQLGCFMALTGFVMAVSQYHNVSRLLNKPLYDMPASFLRDGEPDWEALVFIIQSLIVGSATLFVGGLGITLKALKTQWAKRKIALISGILLALAGAAVMAVIMWSFHTINPWHLHYFFMKQSEIQNRPLPPHHRAVMTYA